MKAVVTRGWLASLLCVVASWCVAQAPATAQEPTNQPDNVPTLNQPIPASMTCREFKALLTAENRTSGLAIMWLDGYYSGRAGLAELPAGWVRTVGQGLGDLRDQCERATHRPRRHRPTPSRVCRAKTSRDNLRRASTPR
jgi:hypothetical protein